MQQRVYNDGIPDKYERIDNLSYIDGWEKNTDGNYQKLTKDGLIIYSIDELPYLTNFNWIMALFAQVNMHDKYWNIYITNKQVIVANEYKETHTLCVYQYSYLRELTRALFFALSDYAKVRRASKDFPEIRQRHLDRLVEKYGTFSECN